MNPLNQPQPATEPADRSDAMLLREFVEHGREDSFRSLVARHVNLVFGVACRRTGDHSLAEEERSSGASLAHLIAPASARAGGSDRIHSATRPKKLARVRGPW